MSIITEINDKLAKIETTLETIERVVGYLKRYGYLIQNNELTLDDVKKAIIALQKFFNMDEDGEIHAETLRLINAPRCGFPDVLEARSNLGKWGKKSLTYTVVATAPRAMSQEEQLTSIERAFKFWSEVADLKFTRTNSNTADLVIGIGSGRKDGFDGSSGILAYAELPNGNNRQLESKFDAAETWVLNVRSGYEIRHTNVACHEFGHLLGLNHSSKRGALMYPTYDVRIEKPQPNDDIPRIQSLYGAPKVEKPENPPNNPPSDGKVVKVNVGEKTLITTTEKVSVEGYRLFPV